MLTEINLIIQSLSGASGIAKGLVAADSAMDKAELKFKVAELMQTLAEVTSATAQIKVNLVEKEDLIRELQNKLRIKETLVRENGVYYKKNKDGRASGEAICSKCWDVHQLLVHIVQPTAMIDLECPNCKQKYSGHNVRKFIQLEEETQD